MFKHKSNCPIGIDITDSTIKIAQIEKKGDKSFLRALSRYEQKDGIISNGEIVNPEPFIKNIKEAQRKALFGNFSSNEAIVSLPDNKSFIKLIQIEKSSNSIASIIGSEIEKHVPYSLEDIYFDWQLISGSSDYKNVLIGVAPKKIVGNYINTIAKCGLNVIAFELETQAIARCLLQEELQTDRNKDNFAYGIIYIGNKKTNFFVYSNYAITNSFSLPISGNDTTELIAKELEITKNQAEKAKLICGLDPEKAQGIIRDLLNEMLSSLNKKISEVVNYYAGHNVDAPKIEKIIICGEGAYIKNIEKEITNYLKLPAELGNAQINLANSRKELDDLFIKTKKLELSQGDSGLSVRHDSSLEYATAIGLALRGSLKINL